MRQDYFSKNKEKIKSIAENTNSYSFSDIAALLSKVKEDGLVSRSMTASKFYDRLVDIGLLSFSVFIDGAYLTRYSFHKDIPDETLLLSLKKRAFLSMSSSLNYQGLSSYRDDFVFISQEQSPKEDYNHSKLTQEAIDNAFSKDYRRTKKVGKYNNKHIVFLEPKNTKEFGVIEINGIKVSSVSRALVEMVVNVQYFRNTKELISVFKKIKSNIDIDEVFDIVEKFDFIYPYHQSIGYILEKIGFKREKLYKFKECVSKLNFYTDKKQDNYKYIAYWKMYVM